MFGPPGRTRHRYFKWNKLLANCALLSAALLNATCYLITFWWKRRKTAQRNKHWWEFIRLEVKPRHVNPIHTRNSEQTTTFFLEPKYPNSQEKVSPKKEIKFSVDKFSRCGFHSENLLPPRMFAGVLWSIDNSGRKPRSFAYFSRKYSPELIGDIMNITSTRLVVWLIKWIPSQALAAPPTDLSSGIDFP